MHIFLTKCKLQSISANCFILIKSNHKIDELVKVYFYVCGLNLPECELSRLVCPAESCRCTGARDLIGGGGRRYHEPGSWASIWTPKMGG